ncbi:MAG: hypothetical protein K2W82_16575 [Candidatus Obscuribacterales bacterium]|nr:hypothetical protein [Candidatus Obscuribacterales bacterium]
MSPGYLILIVYACMVLFTAVCEIRQRMLKARCKRAFASGAVEFAAKFWNAHLRNHFGIKDFDSKRERFVFSIRSQLAAAYARTGEFPDIGVFYYDRRCYGVDNLIWSAMYSAGIVQGFNRDIDHCNLSRTGMMMITLESVHLSTGAGETGDRIWSSEEGALNGVVVSAA